MTVKTYIINLKRSTDRKRYITQEVSNYTFMDIEWMDAIDGKQLSQMEISSSFNTEKFVSHYHRLPAKGEIGCTLSHRKCYRQLLDSNAPYALILEDDVSFICPENTEYVIKEGVRLLEEGRADIILFVSKVWLYNLPHKINSKYSAYPIYNAYGTYAYLINRKGAKRMLKNGKEYIVGDDFPEIRKRGVRIKSIYPNITSYISNNHSFESLIDEERKTAQETTKYTFLERVKIYSVNMYERLATKCGLLINGNIFNAPL